MPFAAALVPILMAALRIFLLANIVGFVVRLFVAFGLYIVLVEPATDLIYATISGRIGGLPPQAIAWLSFFNIGAYIGLILSAYAVQQGANYVLRINR